MLRATSLIARIGARAPVRAAAAAPALARALAGKASDVAKADKAPKDLASALLRELAYEKEDDEPAKKFADLREALAAEWKLTEAPGSARFSLAKKVGAQAVRVDLDVTPMPSDEDYPEDEPEAEGGEEPEGPADGYRMLVTLDGGKGKAMQFGCFVTDHLRIHSVTVHDAGALPTADDVFGGSGQTAAYAGPNFEELDQALQNSFYDYLAERCGARVEARAFARATMLTPPPPPLLLLRQRH